MNGEFKKRKPLPQLYWLYASTSALKLYRTIKPLESVLAICSDQQGSVQPVLCSRRTSALLPQSRGVQHTTMISHFGLLTSGFHYRWAIATTPALDED